MTLQRAYELTGVKEPLALHHAYCEHEQTLFISRIWDYDNPTQIHNQIKSELEKINLESLTDNERVWCREILWFWHHHAISCAVWKQDIKAARLHAALALEYQDDDHPNKITQLLFYLVHHELKQARTWAGKIDDDVEGPTAHALIEWYEQGEFFGPPT